jgi:hypothetical protein
MHAPNVPDVRWPTYSLHQLHTLGAWTRAGDSTRPEIGDDLSVRMKVFVKQKILYISPN